MKRKLRDIGLLPRRAGHRRRRRPRSSRRITLLLERQQPDRRLPGDVGVRHDGRLARRHHQPGRPVLRRRLRRRHRVQDEPVQHRRRRPVPPGRAVRRGRRAPRSTSRRRCRSRVHPAGRHGGRRRPTPASPACSKVTRGVNEVVVDDHVELHRHRHHRLPAVQLLPEPEAVNLRPRRDRCRASGRLPPLNDLLEQVRHRPARRTPSCRASCPSPSWSASRFYVIIYRTRFGFDLRTTGRTRTPPGPRASTRRR